MALSDLPGCGWIAPAAGKALAVLEQHLPIGVAWQACRTPGKTLSKFIGALARAYDDAWSYLCLLASELDPRSTEAMITEWETSVALPDHCLPDALTLEERRSWVIWRLTKRRWSTAADWLDLADLFGLHVEITPGWYVQKPALYAFEYPKRYDIFPKLGRFRVYIDVIGLRSLGYNYGANDRGPGYPVPYGIVDDAFSRFRCLIERVKPANVVVIWNNNPLRNGCYASTFEESFSSSFCGVAAEI